MPEKFTWTDVEDLGILLFERHPEIDPITVRFTQLRKLVEELPEFEPTPGKSPNEQILEAIQAHWIEEHQDSPGADEDDD